VWSWSGFYLGGHAGYGWGRDPFLATALINSKAPLTGINSAGFVGGFQAGANWQTGPWVAGIELDLSGTGINGSNSISATDTTTQITNIATRTDKFDLIGSGRARVGFLVWPNVLIYGTGGLAWTRFVQTRDLTQIGPGGLVFNSTTTPISRFGWVVGGGGEARLWDSNWLARIEYLHYDFGDSGQQNVNAFINASEHLTTDVIRSGLSYKIN
jgi:outer membrane immunogenic protein